ncbi:unnamed protein product [Ambrosiozyma monospora]|uniref:Unnamed protein product n=1 Tax=Ambrosiozyma monospora TaxID=43982 RepID=A0ACB5SRF1_AMBMO|nr:unnamed protein product [Ambrosiozyma monospora]
MEEKQQSFTNDVPVSSIPSPKNTTSKETMSTNDSHHTSASVNVDVDLATNVGTGDQEREQEQEQVQGNVQHTTSTSVSVASSMPSNPFEIQHNDNDQVLLLKARVEQLEAQLKLKQATSSPSSSSSCPNPMPVVPSSSLPKAPDTTTKTPTAVNISHESTTNNPTTNAGNTQMQQPATTSSTKFDLEAIKTNFEQKLTEYLRTISDLSNEKEVLLLELQSAHSNIKSLVITQNELKSEIQQLRNQRSGSSSIPTDVAVAQQQHVLNPSGTHFDTSSTLKHQHHHHESTEEDSSDDSDDSEAANMKQELETHFTPTTTVEECRELLNRMDSFYKQQLRFSRDVLKDYQVKYLDASNLLISKDAQLNKLKQELLSFAQFVHASSSSSSNTTPPTGRSVSPISGSVTARTKFTNTSPNTLPGTFQGKGNQPTGMSGPSQQAIPTAITSTPPFTPALSTTQQSQTTAMETTPSLMQVYSDLILKHDLLQNSYLVLADQFENINNELTDYKNILLMSENEQIAKLQEMIVDKDNQLELNRVDKVTNTVTPRHDRLWVQQRPAFGTPPHQLQQYPTQQPQPTPQHTQHYQQQQPHQSSSTPLSSASGSTTTIPIVSGSPVATTTTGSLHGSHSPHLILQTSTANTTTVSNTSGVSISAGAPMNETNPSSTIAGSESKDVTMEDI